MMSIAPPPAIGGYVMNNVNPFDVIFYKPYGVDTNKSLSDMIEQAIGIIEADADFYHKLETNPKQEDCECNVWGLIHPQIAANLKYIGEDSLDSLRPQIDIVARMLNGLRSSLLKKLSPQNCKQ